MARHPRFDKRDWCGFRTGRGHIFTCRCGCGGHVVIPPQQVAVSLALVTREQERAKREAQRTRQEGERKPVTLAADSFYVEGHEPAGVPEVRTGQRVALRATA